MSRRPKLPRALAMRLLAATEECNRRAILELLPAGPGGVLLDLGCGDGTFTMRMAQRLAAASVTGIEAGQARASLARARGVDVLEGDLDAGLAVASKSVNFVTANQLIEHVRSPDALLGEIRRVLVPGGVACVSTNNLSSWHNVASLTLGMQPMPMHVSDELIVGNRLDPRHGERHEDARQAHLRLFTAPALAELASHHGLEPRTVRAAGYYPLPPRLARVAARSDRRHGAFLIALLERPAEGS